LTPRGKAVAQAKHAVVELVESLDEDGVDIESGTHPVTGWMPGQMNALLAEADAPYKSELKRVDPPLSQTDLVLVTGVNNVVSPRRTNTTTAQSPGCRFRT
jgi:NAD(P) transhydrogenase subunit beta